METKDDRLNRVIARGEASGHSHVLIGEVKVKRGTNDEILIDVGEAGAVLKHILEKPYLVSGLEIWTGEHKDIVLSKGIYKFIQQREFNPYHIHSTNADDFFKVKD